MNRPFGVAVLAILSVVSGLGFLLRGLLVVGIGGGIAAVVGMENPGGGSVLTILVISLAILVVMVACFDFWFAWGAWHLKPWAWSWGVFAQISNVVVSLIAVMGWGTFRTQRFHLLLAIGMLLYLMLPGVKRAFGKS